MDRNLRELFHSAGNDELFGAKFVLPGVLDIAQDTVVVGSDGICSFRIFCRACCCDHAKKLLDGTADKVRNLSSFTYSPRSFVDNHLSCWQRQSLVRFQGIPTPTPLAVGVASEADSDDEDKEGEEDVEDAPAQDEEEVDMEEEEVDMEDATMDEEEVNVEDAQDEEVVDKATATVSKKRKKTSAGNGATHKKGGGGKKAKTALSKAQVARQSSQLHSTSKEWSGFDPQGWRLHIQAMHSQKAGFMKNKKTMLAFLQQNKVEGYGAGNKVKELASVILDLALVEPQHTDKLTI